MPIVEDDVLTSLQQRAAQADQFESAARVLATLNANPETRRETLALLKKANPKLVIPEIDAAQPVLTAVKQTNDRIDALQKALADDKAARETAARSAAATARVGEGQDFLRQRGYDDAGIQAIEKLMSERGILDYEAAALKYEASLPPEEMSDPGASFSRSMPLVGDDTAEELRKAIGMPRRAAMDAVNKWTRGEVHRTLSELRSGR